MMRNDNRHYRPQFEALEELSCNFQDTLVITSQPPREEETEVCRRHSGVVKPSLTLGKSSSRGLCDVGDDDDEEEETNNLTISSTRRVSQSFQRLIDALHQLNDLVIEDEREQSSSSAAVEVVVPWDPTTHKRTSNTQAILSALLLEHTHAIDSTFSLLKPVLVSVSSSSAGDEYCYSSSTAVVRRQRLRKKSQQKSFQQIMDKISKLVTFLTDLVINIHQKQLVFTTHEDVECVYVTLLELLELTCVELHWGPLQSILPKNHRDCVVDDNNNDDDDNTATAERENEKNEKANEDETKGLGDDSSPSFSRKEKKKDKAKKKKAWTVGAQVQRAWETCNYGYKLLLLESAEDDDESIVDDKVKNNNNALVIGGNSNNRSKRRNSTGGGVDPDLFREAALDVILQTSLDWSTSDEENLRLACSATYTSFSSPSSSTSSVVSSASSSASASASTSSSSLLSRNMIMGGTSGSLSTSTQSSHRSVETPATYENDADDEGGTASSKTSCEEYESTATTRKEELSVRSNSSISSKMMMTVGPTTAGVTISILADNDDDRRMSPVPGEASLILSQIGAPLPRDRIINRVLRWLLPPCKSRKSVAFECNHNNNSCSSTVHHCTSTTTSSVVILGSCRDDTHLHQHRPTKHVSHRHLHHQQQQKDEQGMSGVGKTTIAALVASNVDVRRTYLGGIVWLNFGRVNRHYSSFPSSSSSSSSSSPSSSSNNTIKNDGMNYNFYISCLESICKQLDIHERPTWDKYFMGVPSEEKLVRKKREGSLMMEAKKTISDMLYERGERVLIIMDDVSDENIIKWFQFSPSNNNCTVTDDEDNGNNTNNPKEEDTTKSDDKESKSSTSEKDETNLVQLLGTTTSPSLSSISPCTVEVDLLTEDEAIDLFFMVSKNNDDSNSANRHHNDETLIMKKSSPEVKEIVHQCKYHPLAIRTVGRWFRLMQTTTGYAEGLEEMTIDLADCEEKSKKMMDGELTYSVMDMMLSPVNADGQPTVLMRLCLSALTVVFFRREDYHLLLGVDDDSATDSRSPVPIEAVHLLWDALLKKEEQARVEVGTISPSQRDTQIRLITEALTSLGVTEIIKIAETEEEKNGIMVAQTQSYVRLHHDIVRRYAESLSKEAERLGYPITEDCDARWNGAFSTAYLAQKVECDRLGIRDACRMYALENLVSHMIRAAMVQKAAALMNDERFVRERLQTLGWRKGTAMYIKDCKLLSRKFEVKDLEEYVQAINATLGAFLYSEGSKSENEELKHEAVMSLLDLGFSLGEQRFFSQAISQYDLAFSLSPQQTDLAATVLYSMGVTFLELRDHENALNSLEECLQIRSQTLGNKHTLYAETLKKMGDAWVANGDYTAAIEQYDKALDAFDNDYVNNQLLIGNTLHCKGCLYYKRGELDDAIKLFELCLRWRKMALGEKSSDLAPTLYCIGNIYSALGQVSKARIAYEDSIELLELAGNSTENSVELLVAESSIYSLDEEHDACLDCLEKALAIVKNSKEHAVERGADLLRLIACVHMKNGDNEKALKAIKQSFEERESRDLEVAETLFDMGCIHSSQGRTEDALHFFEESLGIRMSQLGDCEKVADSLEAIGNTHKALGDYSLADKYYHETLQMREDMYGEDHEKISGTLYEIGDLKDVMEDFEEARTLFERCLDIRKRTLGADHPDVAVTLYGMGNTLCKQGSYDQSVKCFEETLKIEEKNNGPDNPIVADILHKIGQIEYERGKYENALNTLLEALQRREKAGDQLGISETLFQIGHVYRATDHWALAITNYEDCRSIVSKELGKDHGKVGEIHFALAGTKSDLGMVMEAIESYHQALRIALTVFGEMDDKVGSIYFSMGILEFKDGDHELAKEHLGQFILIREANENKQDLDFVSALLIMGKIYFTDEDIDNARATWKEAYEIFNSNVFAVDYPAVGQELRELLQECKRKKKPRRNSLVRSISKRLSEEMKPFHVKAGTPGTESLLGTANLTY